MSDSVNLVINVFERTYRDTLKSGVIRSIADSNKRLFNEKIVLINNVRDPVEANLLAQNLADRGEIDRFYWVHDHIDASLSRLGLKPNDINPLPHYTNCALVAVTLPDPSQFICYWDAEVRLSEAMDWITPSIELMKQDPRVAVANPTWSKDFKKREVILENGSFSLGYGFSDQLFLVKTSEFCRPIYKFHTLVSLRYPLSCVTNGFEQRIDSYMRRNGRLRATYRPSRYLHPADEGSSYPAWTLRQNIKRLLSKVLIQFMAVFPGNRPEWKVYPRRLI